jgi:redox-sensitive bicupin YhaK (pirin superfamily)
MMHSVTSIRSNDDLILTLRLSAPARLRFLQIWIKPDARGYPPNYGSRQFPSKEVRHNKLQQLLTSYKRAATEEDSGTGVIPIHQDANIFVSEMDPGFQQEFTLEKGRQAYLVCIEGGLSVNGTAMEERDALEVRFSTRST